MKWLIATLLFLGLALGTASAAPCGPSPGWGGRKPITRPVVKPVVKKPAPVKHTYVPTVWRYGKWYR